MTQQSACWEFHFMRLLPSYTATFKTKYILFLGNARNDSMNKQFNSRHCGVERQENGQQPFLAKEPAGAQAIDAAVCLFGVTFREIASSRKKA